MYNYRSQQEILTRRVLEEGTPYSWIFKKDFTSVEPKDHFATPYIPPGSVRIRSPPSERAHASLFSLVQDHPSCSFSAKESPNTTSSPSSMSSASIFSSLPGRGSWLVHGWWLAPRALPGLGLAVGNPGNFWNENSTTKTYDRWDRYADSVCGV